MNQNIDSKYKWNLSEIYNSLDEVYSDYLKVVDMSKEVFKFKGKYNTVENILAVRKITKPMWKIKRRISSYLSLRGALDIDDKELKEFNSKVDKLEKELTDNTAWIYDEFKENPDEFILSLANIEELKHLKRSFENDVEFKKYTLSFEQNEAIRKSFYGIDLYGIFEYITEMEMDFGNVKDQNGEDKELSEVKYSEYMTSKDRVLRENAFKKFHERYKLHNNSLALAYLGKVKSDSEYIKYRGFESVLSANVMFESTTKVYDTLLKVVNDNLATSNRIVKMKSKTLNIPIEDIQIWDLGVNPFEKEEDKVEFEKGKEIVLDALNVLGEEYTTTLKTAFNNNWIDVYPKERKVSGAFCSGGFEEHPHVLLNYNNKMDDVSTLAHEMGHALHNYYTDKTQEVENQGYEILVAEVASTVNEILLAEYLLKNEKDLNKKKFLLHELISTINGTFFRQSMFAEFEKIVHEKAWNYEVLTNDTLNDIYLELCKKYYGDMTINEEIKYHWSRIPHFYNEYYVYTYATGISSAIYIATEILKGNKEYLNKYIEMLSMGSLIPAIDILKIVDVDLESEDTYNRTISYLNEKLDALEELI